MSAAFDRLVARARALGAGVGRAAVESGDHDRALDEGDDPDELLANLWDGATSDGARVLRREIAALPEVERATLPDDEALWDRLYDAWREACEARIRELVPRA